MTLLIHMAMPAVIFESLIHTPSMAVALVLTGSWLYQHYQWMRR